MSARGVFDDSFTSHLEASKLLLVSSFPAYAKEFRSDALAQAVAAYPTEIKDFIEKVINHFVTSKSRRMYFIYK